MREQHQDVKECVRRFCAEQGEGEITEINILKEKHCDRLRPYGFVTFDGEGIVNKICDKADFIIKVKSVRVERAHTRIEMLEKQQGECLCCI